MFIVVTFAQSEYVVSEVERSIQLVLVLNPAFPMEIVVKVGDVSITADGEQSFCSSFVIIVAAGGDDYDSGPYTITIPAGMTSAALDVEIVDDNVIERNETFYVAILTRSLPNGVVVGSPGQAQVTILNNNGK